ncbi:hypothetical protein TrLO_g5760 [Triparma laevis f. longispina]|uniref:Uncharacterized protein n=1 Tax=Triparma laevis f. longispina TaxID=1714387 RepID=A0A9W7KUD0_9STRA|nr:hypothetical protein TrLO_g5760 [Triparma laevis f. longispina]
MLLLLLLFLLLFLPSTTSSTLSLDSWSSSLTNPPATTKKKQFFGGSFKTTAKPKSKTKSTDSVKTDLSKISEIYVPTSSWDLCTPENLLNPSTLTSLYSNSELFLDSKDFKPLDKIDLTSPSAINIWTLNPPPGYFGSEYTIIKTSSYIKASPKKITDLIMDSSRVKVYNSISKGRIDKQVIGKDIDRIDKIVLNRTRPPMQKVDCLFKTLMSSRSNGEGYLIVSRGCVIPDSELDGCKHSTIILGFNRVSREGGGTRLEGVTWVEAKGVPGVVARKIGVKGGRDFVKCLRKVFEGE